MAAQQAQTTYTIGQALRQQTMWEVDYDQPTRGVHRVQATLYYWPVSDAAEDDEGDDDVAYNYQWETERVPAAGVEHIYRAREDGMRVSDYDGQTRIYASRAEAVAACVEALEKRIAKARAALTRLSGKEAR
jgi:hypothetical protein